mgnify:CR=1 FL=1
MENEKRTIMDPGLSLNETLQKDNSEREKNASGPSNEEYVNEHPSLKSLIQSSQNSEPEEEEESPLDKMIRERNEGNGGFVAEEEDPESESLRNPLDTDRRREEMDNKVEEIDDLSLKMKAIVGIKKPESQGEYALMIDAISSIQLDPDTKEPTFIPKSEWFVPRTPEIEEKIKKINNGEDPSENDDDSKSDSNKSDYYDVEKDVKEHEKEELVHVLIDKTGLGQNISFDPEEKAKLAESTLIHLVEVEDKDLKMVEFEKPDPNTSFMDAIGAYQLSVSKVPMTFPASGFKAEMTGLTFGEFADIALDPGDDYSDYIDYDKMRRRMYVIYTHMVNVSIGEFKSFEEFLSKFAYIDMPLAVYGLTIATQPEMDELTFKCQKPDCGKNFNFQYSPRSIIDFDTADIGYLKRVDEINECNPADRIRLAEESPVRRIRRVLMPQSKWIVDLRMVSCGEYLEKILSYVNDIQEKADALEENDPELITIQKKVAFIPVLHSIAQIGIPGNDGKIYRISDADQIMDALLAMPPADINVLYAVQNKYQSNYYIGFSLKNVKCTHCKNVIEKIPITPDELVFLIAQRLGSTEVSFDNTLY